MVGIYFVISSIVSGPLILAASKWLSGAADEIVWGFPTNVLQSITFLVRYKDRVIIDVSFV